MLFVRDRGFRHARPCGAPRAKSYGAHTVPAVAVDDRLAACCAGCGPNEAPLRAAGIGVPLQ
jgi:hypothetical protein